MTEEEQYILYIRARRTKNSTLLKKLQEEHFKPNLSRLEALSKTDGKIRRELYNKEITICIHFGTTTGHVYGHLPIYEDNKITLTPIGYYPIGFRFYSEGSVQKESSEIFKYPTTSKTLLVTQESYEKIAQYVTEKNKKPDKFFGPGNYMGEPFSKLGINCLVFLNKCLIAGGIHDGLIDKFDLKAIEKLPYALIKLPGLKLFRFDTIQRDASDHGFFYMEHNYGVHNETIINQLVNKAKLERKHADECTHKNAIQFFDEKYHSSHYKEALYPRKTSKAQDNKLKVHSAPLKGNFMLSRYTIAQYTKSISDNVKPPTSDIKHSEEFLFSREGKVLIEGRWIDPKEVIMDMKGNTSLAVAIAKNLKNKQAYLEKMSATEMSKLKKQLRFQGATQNSILIELAAKIENASKTLKDLEKKQEKISSYVESETQKQQKQLCQEAWNSSFLVVSRLATLTGCQGLEAISQIGQSALTLTNSIQKLAEASSSASEIINITSSIASSANIALAVLNIASLLFAKKPKGFDPEQQLSMQMKDLSKQVESLQSYMRELGKYFDKRLDFLEHGIREILINLDRGFKEIQTSLYYQISNINTPLNYKFNLNYRTLISMDSRMEAEFRELRLEKLFQRLHFIEVTFPKVVKRKDLLTSLTPILLKDIDFYHHWATDVALKPVFTGLAYFQHLPSGHHHFLPENVIKALTSTNIEFQLGYLAEYAKSHLKADVPIRPEMLANPEIWAKSIQGYLKVRENLAKFDYNPEGSDFKEILDSIHPTIQFINYVKTNRPLQTALVKDYEKALQQVRTILKNIAERREIEHIHSIVNHILDNDKRLSHNVDFSLLINDREQGIHYTSVTKTRRFLRKSKKTVHHHTVVQHFNVDVRHIYQELQKSEEIYLDLKARGEAGDIPIASFAKIDSDTLNKFKSIPIGFSGVFKKIRIPKEFLHAERLGLGKFDIKIRILDVNSEKYSFSCDIFFKLSVESSIAEILIMNIQCVCSDTPKTELQAIQQFHASARGNVLHPEVRKDVAQCARLFEGWQHILKKLDTITAYSEAPSDSIADELKKLGITYEFASDLTENQSLLTTYIQHKVLELKRKLALALLPEGIGPSESSSDKVAFAAALENLNAKYFALGQFLSLAGFKEALSKYQKLWHKESITEMLLDYLNLKNPESSDIPLMTNKDDRVFSLKIYMVIATRRAQAEVDLYSVLPLEGESTEIITKGEKYLYPSMALINKKSTYLENIKMYTAKLQDACINLFTLHRFKELDFHIRAFNKEVKERQMGCSHSDILLNEKFVLDTYAKIMGVELQLLDEKTSILYKTTGKHPILLSILKENEKYTPLIPCTVKDIKKRIVRAKRSTLEMNLHYCIKTFQSSYKHFLSSKCPFALSDSALFDGLGYNPISRPKDALTFLPLFNTEQGICYRIHAIERNGDCLFQAAMTGIKGLQQNNREHFVHRLDVNSFRKTIIDELITNTTKYHYLDKIKETLRASLETREAADTDLPPEFINPTMLVSYRTSYQLAIKDKSTMEIDKIRTQFLSEKAKEYIDYMSKPGVLGGDAELIAINHLYQVDIQIYKTNGKKTDKFGSCSNPKNTVHLLYNGRHYDLLEIYPQALTPIEDASVPKKTIGILEEQLKQQSLQLEAQAKEIKLLVEQQKVLTALLTKVITLQTESTTKTVICGETALDEPCIPPLLFHNRAC